ncbi:MAG: UvrD-helicase domain-containing protein, partial [Desulfobacteraceae bacterium]
GGLVGHDDVRKSAEAVIPTNAPFLRFEPGEIEDLPELLVDEIPDAYLTQEAVEEESPEDYGPQKWLVLGEEDWKRLLVQGDPEDFEIFLYLTPEQAEILETDPPVLLSGTAGSGKTTLSVYYLLRQPFLGKKRLFLTYHPFLRDFSRRIYNGLVAGSDPPPAGPKPDFLVFRELLFETAAKAGILPESGKEVDLARFKEIFRKHRLHKKYDAELVWEEIRSIIKGAKPSIRLERLKRLCRLCLRGELGPEEGGELRETLLGLQHFDFFEKLDRIAKKRLEGRGFAELARSLGAAEGRPNDAGSAVLEKALEMVEKKTGRLADPLLSYEEYLALGRKRAPNFLYERKEIYDIASYYQDRLERDGLWDEIDLCRWGLEHLEKSKEARSGYDLVVCDEVQDFADIQLALIFRLARSPNGVVLTGDPKQIINPSGFRWEEVKGKFYDRGIEVPEVRHLRLNFRCVGSIVRFANTLLDLKQELVGLSGSEMRETWKFNGRPPFLLAGMTEKEVLEQVGRMGAGRVILVRDAEEQQRLKLALETELVFTINQAKGLEFDTALLWKISSGEAASDVWRRIRRGEPPDRTRRPHIRHEINLLYVAVTRARNALIIYDPAGEIWDMARFRRLLCRTEERETLSEIWQTVSTPDEWAAQGSYFFEREYYAAAAECYKNAGDGDRAELAHALALKTAGDPSAAAPLLEKHGRAREAAACYEEIERFDRALSLWETEGEKKRADLCRTALFEQQGDFDRAAEECLRFGDRERALENWLKAENHQKVGEHFVRAKDPLRAAEAFERAGDRARAADLYKKAKKSAKAAELFFKAGEVAKALPLFKKLKDREMLLRCYTALEDFYNAGLMYERDKDMDRAIQCFAKCAERSEEERRRLLQEAEAYAAKRTKIRGAIRYTALGMPQEAAPLFLRTGYLREALAAYKETGDFLGAAEALAANKEYYGAAEVLQESGVPGWVELCAKYFSDYVNSGRWEQFKREEELVREAQARMKENRVEAALARFLAARDAEGIYQAYRRLDRDEAALRTFLEFGMMDEASRWLNEKGEVEVSAELLRFGVEEFESELRFTDLIETSDVLARLLKSSERRLPGAEAEELTNRLLNAFREEQGLGDIPTEPVLDLIVDSGDANAFYHTLRVAELLSSSDKYAPEEGRRFLEAARQKADESGEPGILACCLLLDGDPSFEDQLEDLPLTEKNDVLFAKSRRHFERAVKFYLESSRVEKAAQTCRDHTLFQRAAEILEDSGDLQNAARQYRDSGFLEDALRCYRLLNDDVGMARVYERMEAFQEAARLWERLGRYKDARRVRKHLGKVREKTEQLKLF